MRHLSLLRQPAVFAAVFFGVFLQAQTPTVAPRILGPIDNGSLTVLPGNVSAKALPQLDQGTAPADTKLSGMHLVLSRSREQEAALDRYMAEQLDKSSPNYHKWLTPEQLGRLYGPAQADIDTIVTWLQSRGFTVDHVSPTHTNIAFSGTVQQAEQAFHVSIHTFQANGEVFLSNTADPQIPSALATVVTGVSHLNTIRPKPHSIKAGTGRIDPESGRLIPDTPSSGPSPNLTSGSSGDYTLYVVPGDAATIYDTPNSFNANFSSSGTSYTGKGVTIGLGGEAAIQTSTIVNYRSSFLGDTTTPATTYCSSNQDNSNVTSISVKCSSSSSGISLVNDSGVRGEAYLDTELAGGLAPGATIHYYASKDLMSAVQYAIDNNEVDIMSLSWGQCEWTMTTSDNSYYNGLWKQAASQGIVVTVSTGDSGAAGCDSSSGLFAVDGLAVNGLGSTPYNIAVGGTDYYKLRQQSNFSTYVSTSSSSSNYYRTALKYIPESTWNNSTATDWNNTSSSSYDYNTPYWSGPASNIVGGGGGRSACSTNTTSSSRSGSCTNGYSKPFWQTGTGVPSDGVRDLPDVSVLAANGMDNATWLVCTDDENKAGYTTDCSKQSNGKLYFTGVGGTSASGPAFAGMLALVQQSVGGRLGLDAVKTLYDLSNGSYASSVFHDVTVGNISVYCYDEEAGCSKNSAGYYFMNGYNTNTGYDLATGLGSVDVAQLINYWSSAIGSATATVTATPSSTTLTTSTSLTVSVSVSGSSSLGKPSGTVTLTGGGYTSSATTLSSGSATITVPAGSLSTGTNSLTVTYSGNIDYASATGSTSVTVTTSNPTVLVTPASTSIDTAQSLDVTVSVSGGGATPTGTVALSGGGYSSSSATLSNGSYTFTIPSNSLSAGTVTLTATYNGDSDYSSGSGTTTVTVTQSAYSLAATTPAAVDPGGSATSTVTISSSTAYSGTVTLSCSLTSSPSGATNKPTCLVGTSSVTLSSSTTSAASTVTMSTTASTNSLNRGGPAGWAANGSGAVLALVVFLGLPTRRRNWRSMLSAIAVLVVLGSMAACSGGGGSSSGRGSSGTTAGTYTFTVSGSGNPSLSTTPTTTITLTVN